MPGDISEAQVVSYLFSHFVVHELIKDHVPNWLAHLAGGLAGVYVASKF